MSEKEPQPVNKSSDDQIIPPTATTEFISESEDPIPVIDSEKKPVQIIVNVPKSDTNEASKANRIAIIGTIINVILAVFTYLLFMQANNANKVANSSLIMTQAAVNEAKRANDISEANLILAQENSKTNDSTSKQNIELSKRSLDAQINSIQQTQSYFELEGRAFLTAARQNLDTANLTNSFFEVSFYITDLGRLPAHIYFRKICIVLDSSVSIEAATEKFIENRQFNIKRVNDVISNGMGIKYGATFPGLSLSEEALFERGKLAFYIIGEFWYMNFGTKKRYKMNFTHRITRATPYQGLNYETIRYSDIEVK